jgi:hypothetical protein
LDYFKNCHLISFMYHTNNYQKVLWCWSHLRLLISHKVASTWTILLFFDLSIINWFDQASLYYLHKIFCEARQWTISFQTITFFFKANHGFSKIMPIPISLLKWNQRNVDFESLLKIKLVKDPTHIIQYMWSFDYLVFWK